MRKAAIVVVGLATALACPASAQRPPQPPSGGGSPPAPVAPQAAPVPSQSTKDIVNDAKLDDTAPKGGVNPAILRAEVMLDRVHASPGVIDGHTGKNLDDALAIFARSHHLPARHGLDAKEWDALVAESPGPVLMDYTLTDADVAGPFMPDIPKNYADQAKLKTLAYHSPTQKIAAKFHMSRELLGQLNPGVDLGKAGTRILVANVAAPPIRGRLRSIVVDKHRGEVLALGRHGKVLAAFPATIGSRELPSPSGTWRVKGVAWNPVYYYNPKNFIQDDNHEKLRLPPGPNNPVGSVFIALSKPTYGLHGTPDPDMIDKTASHGCVRMTNWDATELAHLVHPGILVHFK